MCMGEGGLDWLTPWERARMTIVTFGLFLVLGFCIAAGLIAKELRQREADTVHEAVSCCEVSVSGHLDVAR